MSFRSRMFILLAAGTVLTGCATTSRHGLDPGAQAHLESVDLHFTIPQYELNAATEAPVAGHLIGGIIGGLVNAAIDNERADEAMRLLGPIRDRLIDYDHTGALQSRITSELDGIDWLDVDEVVLTRHASETRYPDALESTGADAVAFIDAEYSLTPNFDSLTTSAFVIVYARDEELFPYRRLQPSLDEQQFNQSTYIYRNRFEVTAAVAGSDDKEANAAVLAAPGSTMVRDALESNAAAIARRIAEDLERGSGNRG